MKKIIKNPIFTFILGSLIFGGIVGVSAYTIFANDIGYTPKDSTWKKSNGEDITNVSDAIDELYTKINDNASCEKWTEIENSTANSASYSVNSDTIKLYKCGSVCKITFALRISTNNEVPLITNSKYFPKEEVEYSGIGAGGGYSTGKLLTNGNILVTYNNNGQWTSSNNVSFRCE